jgi:hypothetical protein
MNTTFPDRRKNVEVPPDSLFDDLRQRLAQEAPGRELADLLESVNAMQRAAHAAPQEFSLRFEEFVYRAEEYVAAVRPFFPALVVFLPTHRADAVEPRCFDDPARTGMPARVA